MNRQQISAKVTEVLTEVLDGRVDTVDDEASFMSLGLDSLDMAMLASSAEEAFGVKIPSDRLREIRTLADIVDFLESSLLAEAA